MSQEEWWVLCHARPEYFSLGANNACPAPANLDISHSSLMRSHTVFENRSRGRSRLERPGYWQNRCGFACSPHFPHTHDSTPPVRSWTAEKTAESVKNAGYGRMLTFRMTGGVSGLLMPPSFPGPVGVPASASTTSIPFVTWPKIT